MSTWPSSPEWTNPATLNAGNSYNENDGVTADDFNKIVENLLYLDQYGGTGSIPAEGTIHIKQNGVYDVAKFAEADVAVPVEGIIVNGQLGTYKVAGARDIRAGDFVEFINVYAEGDIIGESVSCFAAQQLDSTHIFVAYGNRTYARALVLTLDSETIHASAKYTVYTGGVARISVAVLSSSRVVVSCLQYSSGSSGTISHYSIEIADDGTMRTLASASSSAKTNTGGYMTDNFTVALNESRVLLTYTDSSSSKYGYVVLLQVSEDGRISSLGSTTMSDYKYSGAMPVRISDTTAVMYYERDDAKVLGCRFVSAEDGAPALGTPLSYTSEFTGSPAINAISADRAAFMYCMRKTYTGRVVLISAKNGNVQKIASKDISNIPADEAYASAIAFLSDNRIIALDASRAHVLTYNDTATLSIGESVTYAATNQNYVRAFTTGADSVLVIHGTSSAISYKYLKVFDDVIDANTDSLGTFVQRATTNSHMTGIASTAGTPGGTVEVYSAKLPYPVRIKAQNVDAEFPALIFNDESLEIAIVPRVAYEIVSVSVSGCEFAWDADQYTLTLSNATASVSIEVSTQSTTKYTSSATELTSGTELTSNVSCNVGDLVVAAIAARDTLTLSDGWTLVSTSDINSADTAGNGQRLSWAYKFAESTTESITVTQASAQRLYVNMVALQGATGVTDNGYTYRDNLEGGSLIVNKPTGLVLWSMSASMWNSGSPYPLWGTSNNMPIIQLGNASQSRLGLGLDQSDDASVTFTASLATTTNTTMTVGCLTVQGMDKFY